MDIYVIVLRIIHILGGVFWVGATWMIAGYLLPTARTSAPEGPRFLQKLFAGNLPIVTSIAGGLNILAGLLLYWRDSGGLQLSWIISGAGLGFTIGALAALAAFGLGFGLSRPLAAQLGTLGQQIAKQGKPPTAEQAVELKGLSDRLTQAAVWTAIALGVALFFMAVARYL